jgi:hypothetical protein
MIVTFDSMTVRLDALVAIQQLDKKNIRIHTESDSFDVEMEYTAALMIWRAAQPKKPKPTRKP